MIAPDDPGPRAAPSRWRWTNDSLFGFLLVVLFTLIAAFVLWAVSKPVFARDAGQWAGTSPEVRAWFESLTAPDTNISCCGEADGYPVKDWITAGPDLFNVTLEDGRTFVVPAKKRTWRFGNPTGKDILFIGADGQTIYCFVVGAGI